MKIRDVAEAAGVSIATVSRVLNHPELVTQETRERIQEIISKNNYAPNTEQRQTKRTKKKQVIAVILPSFELYRNLYSGVHQICAAKKYCVQMYLIEDNPDDLKRIVKNIENGFADGVIIALEVMDSYVKEKLNEKNYYFYTTTILNIIGCLDFVEMSIACLKPESPKLLVIDRLFCLQVLWAFDGDIGAAFSMQERVIKKFTDICCQITDSSEKLLDSAEPESLKRTNVQLDSYSDRRQWLFFNESPALLFPGSPV